MLYIMCNANKLPKFIQLFIVVLVQSKSKYNRTTILLILCCFGQGKDFGPKVKHGGIKAMKKKK